MKCERSETFYGHWDFELDMMIALLGYRLEELSCILNTVG